MSFSVLFFVVVCNFVVIKSRTVFPKKLTTGVPLTVELYSDTKDNDKMLFP